MADQVTNGKCDIRGLSYCVSGIWNGTQYEPQCDLFQCCQPHTTGELSCSDEVYGRCINFDGSIDIVSVTKAARSALLGFKCPKLRVVNYAVDDIPSVPISTSQPYAALYIKTVDVLHKIMDDNDQNNYPS